MKKKTTKIIAGVAIAAAAAVTLTGCGNKKPEVKADESKRSAVHTENMLFADEYNMDITLHPDENNVEIISTASIENNTDTTLDEILFLNPSSKVYQKDGNSGKSWEVRNVYIGKDESAKLEYELDSSNPSIIKVSLGDKKLSPKDKLDITIDVKEDIPFGDARFGFYNTGKYAQYVLTSCYPQMAEYREGNWVINDSQWTEDKLRDNNLSQFSDYHVKLHAPEEYTAVASGTEVKDDDGVINIDAVDTRDFAIILSDGFRSSYFANDDMTVNYYFIENAKSYKEDKKVVEMCMPGTIDGMNDNVAKYSWNQFDVVPLYNDSGCNSYTGIMTFGAKEIIDGLDGGAIDDYRKKMLPIFKEGLLGQWFTEMIGVNRATDGWISRGMLVWFNDYINYSTTNEAVDRNLKEILDEAKEKYPEAMNLKLNEKVDDAETAFARDCYKGAEFVEVLRSELGEEDFFKMMSEFMDEFYLKDVTSQNFINTLMKHDKGKMQTIVDDYFVK